MSARPWLEDGPRDAPTTLVLAHGAGGPMDSPFMETIARGLSTRGVRVVRFEFPYMRRRREGGGRGALDRPPILLDAWREVVAALGGGAGLAIGGKSLGGRMASMLADELDVRALVCLGYPFHPPDKPERPRTAHLERLRTPTLIVQGTRDPFGRPEEVATYSLSPAIEVLWLDDGDHSFAPPRRATASAAASLERAIDATHRHLSKHTPLT